MDSTEYSTSTYQSFGDSESEEESDEEEHIEIIPSASLTGSPVVIASNTPAQPTSSLPASAPWDDALSRLVRGIQEKQTALEAKATDPPVPPNLDELQGQERPLSHHSRTSADNARTVVTQGSGRTSKLSSLDYKFEDVSSFASSDFPGSTSHALHLRLARRVPFDAPPTEDPSSASSEMELPVKNEEPLKWKRGVIVFLVFLLLAAVGYMIYFFFSGYLSRRARIGAQITTLELEAHAAPEDCWILIHGRVFDISQYDHPGGRSLLTSHCGMDATEPFRSQHAESMLESIEGLARGIWIPLPTNPPVIPPTPAPTLLRRTLAPTQRVVLVEVSLRDIEQRTVSGGCWTSVDGFVYDLSDVVLPSVLDINFPYCGLDASHDFRIYPARIRETVLQQYRFGVLVFPATTIAPTTQPTYISTSTPTVAPTTSPTPKADVVIGRSELAGHDDPEIDCWIAIHGTVYDLTEFAPTHPGGFGNLTAHCGTDGSFAYAQVHTVRNLNLARGFIVGSYEPEPTAAPTQSPTASRTLSTIDLAVHGNPEDCWVAILGGVYDFTSWAPSHPGGEASITAFCGVDATESFGLHHNRTTLETMAMDYFEGRFDAET